MSQRTQLSRAAFCTSTAVAAVALTLPFGTGTAAAAGLPAQDELAVLAKLGSLMEGVWPRGAYPNAEGAVGSNTSGYINIGFQYYTFALLPLAVIQHNTRYVDALLRIAEYAFAHQHSGGRFDYSESNGTVTTGTPPSLAAEASSATNFFYDFGHTLLVLPQDPWFASSAECKPFRARLDALRDKTTVSLNWLLTQRALLAQDSAATNRTLAHALAYYFTGRALGRRDAMDVGREIFKGAIGAQLPDGTFLEANGFDSSYQMAGTLQCEWMYLNLDPADADLRDPAWRAIGRAVRRELPSIDASGEVATAGNSRVTKTGEVYEGHRKTVNAKQVFAALGYYGVMAGDDDVMATTRRVYHHYYPDDKVDF